MSYRILAITLVLFALGCGSTPKNIRYYQVVPPDQGEPSGDLIIGVEPFYADGPYSDQRIVFRESSYRVDYYYYHRWSAPPGLLVSEYLRTSLQNSGHFKTVLSGFTADATAMVGGRVVAFEEIDHDSDEWRAHVTLDFYLRDGQTGVLIWSKQISEEEVASEQSPEGIAKAMSIALGRITERVAPEISRVTAQAINKRESSSANPNEDEDEDE